MANRGGMREWYGTHLALASLRKNGKSGGMREWYGTHLALASLRKNGEWREIWLMHRRYQSWSWQSGAGRREAHTPALRESNAINCATTHATRATTYDYIDYIYIHITYYDLGPTTSCERPSAEDHPGRTETMKCTMCTLPLREGTGAVGPTRLRTPRMDIQEAAPWKKGVEPLGRRASPEVGGG
eukprot:scaffold6896_cov172-Isochrysis_galbana.AAC.2